GQHPGDSRRHDGLEEREPLFVLPHHVSLARRLVLSPVTKQGACHGRPDEMLRISLGLTIGGHAREAADRSKTAKAVYVIRPRQKASKRRRFALIFAPVDHPCTLPAALLPKKPLETRGFSAIPKRPRVGIHFGQSIGQARTNRCVCTSKPRKDDENVD